jgi:hypothetical protein
MSRERCTICNDPRKRDWVARRHSEGHTFSDMESMSRDAQMVMKRETIAKHVQNDLYPASSPPTREKHIPQQERSRDVATLVADEVVRKLEDGTARVTVQHGLQAQQLLDRRAERAKDRELAITLARLLHAPSAPAGLIEQRREPLIVIEGEYEPLQAVND